MPPVGRIFPLPEPPAPPPPPPPTTGARDRLLVVGLTILLGGAALEALAALVDVVDYADSVSLSGLHTASAALSLVSALAIVVAWTTAALAFRPERVDERARLLVLAATAVAIAAGFDVLAAGLSASGDSTDDLPGTVVAGDLVTLVGAILLLAVGAGAAAAFAGPRAQRDGRLAWCAIGFAASAGVGMVAIGLEAIALGDLDLDGDADRLVTGVWISAFAQIFAVAAATVAGGALLTPARRDRVLAAATALWGLASLVAALGGFLGASAMRDVGYATLTISSVRTSSLAGLVAVAGAAFLVAAFAQRRGR